jgi:hypothetical protein
VLQEGFLESVKLPSLSQPLYSEDFFISGIQRQDQAGIHRLALKEDSAGTAMPAIATLLSAGEPQLFPEHIQKGMVGFYHHLSQDAVDCEFERDFHRLSFQLFSGE